MKSPVQSIDTVSASSVPLTRSILRTPQGERRLWDLDPQHMSGISKTLVLWFIFCVYIQQD